MVEPLSTLKMISAQNIKLDLFDAYFRNGVATGHIDATATAIFCPLCLGLVQRVDVAGGVVPLEHIIPQHSTADKLQRTPGTRIGVKNVRSGLTITCSACNCLKGRTIDSFMRNRILPGKRSSADYPYGTGTAILTYGYLLMFAVFGYAYILQTGMDEIRLQFKTPHLRVTKWLDHAKVCLDDQYKPVVCNEWGYPFVVGRRLEKGGSLEILFWRFKAEFPSNDCVKTAVCIPESILRLAYQSS